MRTRALISLLAAAAGALIAPAGEIADDPPVATRPAAGDVTGRIAPAGKLAEVYAVCRATGKRYAPATFDAKTGRFAFRGLPGDATYDVGIVTRGGARVEGIDLSWHEARLLRLAAIRRKQLKMPAGPEHEFSDEDVAELLRYARDLRGFSDLRRVLYLRGEATRATMLVEVMRVRDFYAKRGSELIWRMELWYFRYRYGGWERVGNVERVLQRRRIPGEAWRKITLVYDPALSVYVDEKGRSQPLRFTIPEKLDPARGRIAGTEPKQDTRPIIIGPQPATAPAPGSAPAGDEPACGGRADGRAPRE